MTRQIVLDTETTGLDPKDGHRLIEIGCVELKNRRPTQVTYHRYLNPERDIDEGAVAVHGIERAQLASEPRFFEIVEEFLAFVRGAELIIHNAPFDAGFIDHELALAGEMYGRLQDHCTITDTLAMARTLHPGQRNTLDALCSRYEIDNARRVLHGALLDAEILADVYLAMTGGQSALTLEEDEEPTEVLVAAPVAARTAAIVVEATAEERAAHEAFMEFMKTQTELDLVWERQYAP